jgi:hypothetical protein
VTDLIRRLRGEWPGPAVEPDADMRARLLQRGQVGVRRGGLGLPASYTQKVLATRPGALIAYWPLNEASGGTTAVNAEGTTARNGTYTNVTLGTVGIGDGNTAASFDGSTSHLNVFSSSLASAFNGAEGTYACWLRVSGAGVWSDATIRRVVRVIVNATNQILLFRSSNNNTIGVTYTAGGTNLTQGFAIGGTTEWAHLALTWSKAADQVIGYWNGAQFGTLTGLGIWEGTPTLAMIGAQNTTPTSVWSGSLARAGLWTAPLTPAELRYLARAY